MKPSSVPIVPPSMIGMLGGGQLGKYALMAANAMGYRTIVVDPDTNAPARIVADEHVIAAYDDAPTLERLVGDCSVVTTEFENAPADALGRLATSVRVAPSADAVAVAQNRIVEKSFLTDHGIAVGPHVAAPTSIDAKALAAARELADRGAIVKTAQFGYDGKGQRRVTGREELDAALAEFAGNDCIVEALLDLRAEVSVVVARTTNGTIQTWPVTENTHVDGILDVSVAPARISREFAARATDLGTRVANELDYVGVLAVEMFIVGDDELLVNELAPRPHNSGHWTLDASVTSQFEQQIRAVCGVGLGATAMTAPAVAMVNLLGDLWFTEDATQPVEPDWAAALADPAATLHLYGKTEPRRGRKMGHLTVTAATPDAAEARARKLRAQL
jgi:5-(carboxyamino)imidazole ribonucleotide synthase